MVFYFSLNLIVFGIYYTSANLSISDSNATTSASNSTLPVFNLTLFEESCPKPNTLSAGNAFWIVFVFAVACVVQLPGSIFLFERSNFYRFSPDLGIVDALATIALITRGIYSGYGWPETIVAVFLVRDGIGRGDLWWREELPFGITSGRGKHPDVPG
jgi:hypothetical protein